MDARPYNPYSIIGSRVSLRSFLSHSANPHASFQTVLSVE